MCDVVYTVGNDLPAHRRAGNPAGSCAICSRAFKVRDEATWTMPERNVNSAYRAPRQLVHYRCLRPAASAARDAALEKAWAAALEKAVDAL